MQYSRTPAVLPAPACPTDGIPPPNEPPAPPAAPFNWSIICACAAPSVSARTATANIPVIRLRMFDILPNLRLHSHRQLQCHLMIGLHAGLAGPPRAKSIRYRPVARWAESQAFGGPALIALHQIVGPVVGQVDVIQSSLSIGVTCAGPLSLSLQAFGKIAR